MSFDINMQYDRLYRYCYYHTHNRILAQDIVQEKNLQDQPYEKEQSTGMSMPGDDTQKNLITKLGVQRALSRLSEEERELLLLISVNEVSAREAGMILGISRFAVYRRLRLAQKHFRTELGKEGIDGDY